MWRRNESAVISKSRWSPRSCQDADSTTAHEDFVLRPGRRERAEVVLAGEQRRARGQPLDVERLRPPPAPAHLERAALAPPVQPIAVRPRPRREARVEVRRRFFRQDDRDVVGKSSVQRLGRALERRPAGHVDRDDVAERVHARVRAARDRETVDRPEQRAERLAYAALDRAQAGLRGPAAEVRAVVLEGELEAQARSLRRRLGLLGRLLLAPAQPAARARSFRSRAALRPARSRQLEVGHRRGVALARAELDHARVAARAVLETEARPRRRAGARSPASAGTRAPAGGRGWTRRGRA